MDPQTINAMYSFNENEISESCVYRLSKMDLSMKLLNKLWYSLAIIGFFSLLLSYSRWNSSTTIFLRQRKSQVR